MKTALQEFEDWFDRADYCDGKVTHKIQELLEEEKEQHKHTWNKAVESVHGTTLPEFDNFDDYYKETYEKEVPEDNTTAVQDWRHYQPGKSSGT